jgi:hypothetical protein
MHLRNIVKGAGDHEARVREVEALADDAREIQDLGHDHSVFPARQEVAYVVAQHLSQNTASA